jgi:hypothetical protein
MLIGPMPDILSLFQQARPLRSNSGATPLCPTPDAVVHAMLDAAQVTSADVAYDLGSGDAINHRAAENTALAPWASRSELTRRR